jgi:predicted kinase
MKLIIFRGLPASGKTTYAQRLQEGRGDHVKRVNRDDLRDMIDNGIWSKGREKEIIKLRDYLIRDYLMKGYDVISDDTNLSEKTYLHIRNIGVECGAEFELQDLRNVPLLDCIERDSKRENSVGKKVIMRFYNDYIKKEDKSLIANQERNYGLKNCIISDIDGTFAYMNGRSPYDYSKVDTDLPNLHLSYILDLLCDSKYERTELIFLSGRKYECFDITEKWLARYINVPFQLLMRKDRDDRPDEIIKEELYNEHIKDKYNVLAVFDDRPKVIRMWKKLGLFTCDVNRQDPRIDF